MEIAWQGALFFNMYDESSKSKLDCPCDSRDGNSMLNSEIWRCVYGLRDFVVPDLSFGVGLLGT